MVDAKARLSVLVTFAVLAPACSASPPPVPEAPPPIAPISPTPPPVFAELEVSLTRPPTAHFLTFDDLPFAAPDDDLLTKAVPACARAKVGSAVEAFTKGREIYEASYHCSQDFCMFPDAPSKPRRVAKKAFHQAYQAAMNRLMDRAKAAVSALDACDRKNESNGAVPMARAILEQRVPRGLLGPSPPKPGDLTLTMNEVPGLRQLWLGVPWTQHADAWPWQTAKDKTRPDEPLGVYARYRLAMELLKAGDSAKALAELEALPAGASERLRGEIALGIGLVRSSGPDADPAKAAAAFRRAAAAYPESTLRSRLELAAILSDYRAGRFAEAFAVGLEAKRLERPAVPILTDCLERLGGPDKAPLDKARGSVAATLLAALGKRADFRGDLNEGDRLAKLAVARTPKPAPSPFGLHIPEPPPAQRPAAQSPEVTARNAVASLFRLCLEPVGWRGGSGAKVDFTAKVGADGVTEAHARATSGPALPALLTCLEQMAPSVLRRSAFSIRAKLVVGENDYFGGERVDEAAKK